MLMRTDPFRDFDRLAQQVRGTAARPAVMPMDAWRDGDRFIVEFEAPTGVESQPARVSAQKERLTIAARTITALSAASRRYLSLSQTRALPVR